LPSRSPCADSDIPESEKTYSIEGSRRAPRKVYDKMPDYPVLPEALEALLQKHAHPDEP
jgi:hypothetical protein